MTVLEEGQRIEHPFNMARLPAVLLLLAACLGLWRLRVARVRAAVRERG